MIPLTRTAFTGAQDLFSTMRILASLPENQLAPKALKHVFRRALRCGGMEPEKISESPLLKSYSPAAG